jgi:exopolysaccharide biosynthesis predicted pyruvyltransferase EpsI
MDKVISNFGDFEKLKNSIIEKAIVNESWEFPNSQELTKRMVNEIGSSLEENKKLQRRTWNCAMEFFQMSHSIIGNRNFSTQLAFSILNETPHIFMSNNRHVLSIISNWIRFIKGFPIKSKIADFNDLSDGA